MVILHKDHKVLQVHLLKVLKHLKGRKVTLILVQRDLQVIQTKGLQVLQVLVVQQVLMALKV